MYRIRVGIAGAGSVAGWYLLQLRDCPEVDVVSICDVVPDRAEARSAEFDIPNRFTTVPDMLAGPPFDLLLNVTSMPAHTPVNRQALDAGRHVFCEKPFAYTRDDGEALIDLARDRGLRLWAAPTAVLSPQFRCLAETVARGELGHVRAAHACYGHGGPTWGPWFYRKGGGCLFDLAVYNVTTLTGLLGPVRGVACFAAAVTPERVIEGETVRVESEDNAMLLLDHGQGVFSHIQTGFVYGAHNSDRTLELIGTAGAANLLGWDWEPKGVQVSRDGHAWETRCTDPEGYRWENGVAHAARCLLTGEEGLMRTDHALHVVEVLDAAHKSAESGCRVSVESRFHWPLVPA